MSDKNRTGSTTGFTIRPMREEDLQIVGEMTATTFTPYEDPNSPYLDILRDVTPRFQNADANFVAVDDVTDQILGAVTLAAGGNPWASIAQEGEIELRTLAVDEAAQGCGIGSTLVRTCQEYAVQNGFHTVVLSTRENMVPAHRVYERMGFQLERSRFWSPVPGLIVRCYVWPVPTATR